MKSNKRVLSVREDEKEGGEKGVWGILFLIGESAKLKNQKFKNGRGKNRRKYFPSRHWARPDVRSEEGNTLV